MSEVLFWPLWPVTFAAGLSLTLRHLRRRGAGVGALAGVVVLFVAMAAAAVLPVDFRCSVTGLGAGHEPPMGLIGVALVVLFVLLGALGVAPERALIAALAAAPILLLEGIFSAVALNGYCAGQPAFLQAQVALALAIPAVLVARFATRPAMIGVLGLLLPAQVGAVAVRVRQHPLACVDPETLIERVTDFDRAVVAADFDGDGSADLARTDEGGGPLRIFHGDGRIETTPLPSPGAAVAAADFDGDGRADLVIRGVEDRGSRRAGIRLALNRDGAFRPGPELLSEPDKPPGQLAVGDLDGDGNADLVALEGGAAVVLRDRDGRLERGPALGQGQGQSRVAVADMDGDGRADVVTLATRSSPGGPSRLLVHRNAGGERFEPGVVAEIEDYVLGFALADVDGDGDVDVLATGLHRRLHVLVNRGGGRFEDRSDRSKAGAETVVAADVNGDGRPDAVLSAEYASEDAQWPGDLWVRLNRGGGAFGDAQALARPRSLLAVADVAGDGRADFVIDDPPRVVVLRTVDCSE